MRLLAALLVGAVFCGLPFGAASGQTISIGQATPGTPTKSLPPSVKAPAGKITLFADYGDVTADGVRVYIVNRTSQSVAFEAQDGDPYLKLEVLDAKTNKWVRAQPHQDSFCGLSYHAIALDPEEFYATRGLHPTSGTAATVRYRLYDDVDVASNTAAGFYDPAELDKARTDRLAIEKGGRSLLEEVLFAKTGPPSPDELEKREEALRKVADLPPTTAVAILERVLHDPSRTSRELGAALRSLRNMPGAYAIHIRRILRDPSPALRRATLSELRFIEDLAEPGFIAMLVKEVANPQAADLDYLLECIGGYRTTEVEAQLASISTDARYRESVRTRARYELEQWFGDAVVDLRLTPRGNYSDGHKVPVFVDVTLTNSSGRRVTFDYSRPTDVLGLYLTDDDGRDHRFLAPKKSVAWYTKPAQTGATHVDLAPGAAHTLTVRVADYFDLPQSPGGGHRPVTLWASARILGEHRIPKLGGGGAGLNPR